MIKNKVEKIPMELAVHIRDFSQTNHLDGIDDQLAHDYDSRPLGGDSLPPVNRIYIGDEFCPMRLPKEKAIGRSAQFTQINDMGLTLLTPVLTDLWLDRCISMFDTLAEYMPRAEVVVNDLGTLHFLKHKYPAFQLSMGRLFNKGFKDPRMAISKKSMTKEIQALLSESTYDHPEFESIVAALGLSRVERDIMPNAEYLPADQANFNSSYYFPFGYVTTGRVCWTASFAKNAVDAYKPLYHCSCPCEELTFSLCSDSTQLDLLQCGNTIFYRYPAELMTALMKQALKSHDRLVYQGFCL